MKKFLMGNEAFAYAALEAGVNVVAGYPGTPSSELVETVAKLHAQGAAKGVHVEWSTNEKCALEMLAGASYCGARALFTCKQMGLNVASDPLMCVNYVGIKGGLVLFVADDPGPISSQTEQDTRRFASFAKVPVLDPSTPEECFAMIKQAFELSETYKTPVIVRPTTRICHASTFFDVSGEFNARTLPEEGFERGPQWVIFPARAYKGHGEINERLPLIAQDFSTKPEFCAFNASTVYGEGVAGGAAASSEGAGAAVEGAGEGASGATTAAPTKGIVASGVSAAYAKEALSMLANRASALGAKLPQVKFIQIGTPYPFPEATARAFTAGLQEIQVFEELDNVLEDEFVRFAGKEHLPYNVHGRLDGSAPNRGENSVDVIACRIAEFLEAPELSPASPKHSYTAEEPLPTRPPVLCAGCPHRGSFYAIKRALGKTPAVLCGDIGCYTLGNAKPLDAVDTCLCMGAGITMAQGFSVAQPDRKALAFVGDSTFFASGMTGLANAAYNGHDITVVVLDNATTAMTGNQPHPGTGVTLMGSKNEPLSIFEVLDSLGFKCVTSANPLNLEESMAAAKTAIDYAGPSAIVFQQPCVQLTKPKAPVHVNTQVCTGCKRCITEIGCPGIGFDLQISGPASKDRGQAYIDTSLCNGCGLCTQLCPTGALALPTEGDAEKEGESGNGANAQRTTSGAKGGSND